jgi:hypothetical protein
LSLECRVPSAQCLPSWQAVQSTKRFIYSSYKVRLLCLACVFVYLAKAAALLLLLSCLIARQSGAAGRLRGYVSRGGRFLSVAKSTSFNHVLRVAPTYYYPSCRSRYTHSYLPRLDGRISNLMDGLLDTRLVSEIYDPAFRCGDGCSSAG